MYSACWTNHQNMHWGTHQVPFQPNSEDWTEWERLWKKSGTCEFIANVIGMASEGINLIKIIGVHPLYVILRRGWRHSMLAISSKLKRVWRWIAFPLLQEIIQLVNFLEKHTFEKMWGLFMSCFHFPFNLFNKLPIFYKLEEGVWEMTT